MLSNTEKSKFDIPSVCCSECSVGEGLNFEYRPNCINNIYNNKIDFYIATELSRTHFDFIFFSFTQFTIQIFFFLELYYILFLAHSSNFVIC